MTHFYRLRKLYSIAIVLILWLCVLPIINRNAWIYNTGIDRSEKLQAIEALPGWQLDPLDIEPGVILPGIVRPSTALDAPWILYLPGNGATQIEGGQKYLERLASLSGDSKNWGLSVWAMRGFGGTPGVPSENNFRTDYKTIYRYIQKTYNVKPENIHIVGFSLGTDFALQLAGDLSRIGESPASISLLSTQGMTQATWTMRRKEWYARWLPPDRYDLRPAFNSINSPVLIIEAENDILGSMNYLLKVLKEKPVYIELHGGNHLSSITQQYALESVRNWISINNTQPVPSQ